VSTAVGAGGSSGDGLRAVDGRIPGRRGQQTRARLLDVTRDLLETTGYRELRVVDIARMADMSSATFYQYFHDVHSAILVLADDFAVTSGARLEAVIVDADWTRRADEAANQLADAFLDIWARNQPLLRVIDLASGEGDERFAACRRRLLNPVGEALAAAVRAQVAAAEVARRSPNAVAGVLTAMLAHVSAHQRGLEEWGASVDALRATMAGIVRTAIAGEL